MKKFTLLFCISLFLLSAYKTGIIPATPAGDLIFVSACVPVVAIVAMIGGALTSAFLDWLRARR